MGSSVIIDWESENTYLFLNPQLRHIDSDHINRAVNQLDLKSGIWLTTSGTESASSAMKLVFLKKSAILTAAASVCRHLNVDADDIWLNPLPQFHIGGLSVFARSFLSGSRSIPFDGTWNAQNFHQTLVEKRVTVTSLVPTQVFDLVQHQLPCPPSLSRVLLGGGAIAKDLFRDAKQLGWPLLPSYGMTETSAALAIAPLRTLNHDLQPSLQVLDHGQLKKKGDKWTYESQALFEGYLHLDDDKHTYQLRPKPFVLDDQLSLDSSGLQVLGRESELIKILGETVNLLELETRVQSQIQLPVAIEPVSDARRGYKLRLWAEGLDPEIDLNTLNQNLAGFERFYEIRCAEVFPRTALGKIRKKILFGN